MKKFFFTAFALIACLSASAQHQLSCQLEGVSNGKVVVRLINEAYTGYEKTDTLAAPGGKFVYDVPGLTGFHFVMISDLTTDGSRPKAFRTFVAQGEQGSVIGSFDKGKMSGSKLYTDYQKGLDALDGIADEKYDEAALVYIKEHASEDASTLLCTNMDKPENGLDLLAESVTNGVMKGFITAQREQIKKMREQEAKRAEAMKNLQPGMPAPEITLNDLDGKPLSLSQLKGKYVILDWWGSWCIWCIRGIPKMKEYYAKYSDKMEILGIDCNDTEEKWKAAVKEHELPWKHVYKPKDSKLTDIYAIEGYPTKCIINPDGTINKIIIGEDPTFYDYLDSLFK